MNANGERMDPPDLSHYEENRIKFPLEELARYGGRHLAFSPDGKRILDGREKREWPAWVGFTSAKLNYPLLGFAGFLQFFTATFHGDREHVELTVNCLHPGT